MRVPILWSQDVPSTCKSSTNHGFWGVLDIFPTFFITFVWCFHHVLKKYPHVWNGWLNNQRLVVVSLVSQFFLSAIKKLVPFSYLIRFIHVTILDPRKSWCLLFSQYLISTTWEIDGKCRLRAIGSSDTKSLVDWTILSVWRPVGARHGVMLSCEVTRVNHPGNYLISCGWIRFLQRWLQHMEIYGGLSLRKSAIDLDMSWTLSDLVSEHGVEIPHLCVWKWTFLWGLWR